MAGFGQNRKATGIHDPLKARAVVLQHADRKLAIIDGRIVQVGDDVRGARVVEITPNSVLFRDRDGRLRKLSLEDSGR